MVAGIQINMRFDPEVVSKIDEIVASGQFENRTEFVKYCVRMTLSSFKSRSPPPLVTEALAQGIFSLPLIFWGYKKETLRRP